MYREYIQISNYIPHAMFTLDIVLWEDKKARVSFQTVMQQGWGWRLGTRFATVASRCEGCSAKRNSRGFRRRSTHQHGDGYRSSPGPEIEQGIHMHKSQSDLHFTFQTWTQFLFCPNPRGWRSLLRKESLLVSTGFNLPGLRLRKNNWLSVKLRWWNTPRTWTGTSTW